MHETGVIEIEEVFIIITLILSPRQTQKPGRGKKTFTIEDELGQDKLSTVEDKSENVAKKINLISSYAQFCYLGK